MAPDERAQFISEIAAALRTRSTDKQLTDQESEWVRLAIQKEAQVIAFRKAVIEKSLTALATSLMLAVAGSIVLWFTTHIYKP